MQARNEKHGKVQTTHIESDCQIWNKSSLSLGIDRQPDVYKSLLGVRVAPWERSLERSFQHEPDESQVVQAMLSVSSPWLLPLAQPLPGSV
jgi:hypothetical protein